MLTLNQDKNDIVTSPERENIYDNLFQRILNRNIRRQYFFSHASKRTNFNKYLGNRGFSVVLRIMYQRNQYCQLEKEPMALPEYNL